MQNSIHVGGTSKVHVFRHAQKDHLMSQAVFHWLVCNMQNIPAASTPALGLACNRHTSSLHVTLTWL